MCGGANTWVKGTTAQVPNVNFGARILKAVDGLPGMTWYIDPKLINTQTTIFDKKAIKIVQSGFICVLTGI